MFLLMVKLPDKVVQENDLHKEAPVIQMTPKDAVPLQPAMAKANGTTMNGKEHFKQNQIQQPRIKRSRGLRF